jgi:SSS family solute:Na+ symporter
MGMPAVITVLVFYFILAGPIRRLPILSLPDLVEERYGRTVRHIASILIIWYMILLASSQMVAIGNFLSQFMGTTYLNGLILGTSVVLVYSALGGFFSVVVTDGFQFFLLAAGILGLFFLLAGGLSFQELQSAAVQVGADEYFNFFSNINRNLLIFLSFTFAWIISPIVWQRIQAARTEREAKKGLLMSGGTFLFIYGIIVFIGMLSLPLFLTGEIGGTLLPSLISTYTGRALGAVLFVGIAAAVMSTMDTAINTGALSLTRDVFQQVSPKKKLKNPVNISRLSTLIVGASAAIIAVHFQSILKTLGLAAEIMAEGFFIPGMAMLFLKKKKPLAGLLSLTLGGSFSLVSFLCEIGIFQFVWPSWPYTLPFGMGLCLTGFLTGLALDRFNLRSKRNHISL